MLVAHGRRFSHLRRTPAIITIIFFYNAAIVSRSESWTPRSTIVYAYVIPWLEIKALLCCGATQKAGKVSLLLYLLTSSSSSSAKSIAQNFSAHFYSKRVRKGCITIRLRQYLLHILCWLICYNYNYLCLWCNRFVWIITARYISDTLLLFRRIRIRNIFDLN